MLIRLKKVILYEGRLTYQHLSSLYTSQGQEDTPERHSGFDKINNRNELANGSPTTHEHPPIAFATTASATTRASIPTTPVALPG